MADVLSLRGHLSNRKEWILTFVGIFALILFWYLLTAGSDPLVNTNILPKPLDVFKSFGQLINENSLFKNICFSLGLNILGYTEAIFIAVPLGFLIGLFPTIRGLFQHHIDAIRYLPLTALTGIFILWFGLGIEMKVHFLAFGILIYLLPVVVQRIDEVKEVYLLTVYTLGANTWQTIRTVFFPSVISRLSDDIRVLTAISWTYIIIAEAQGNEGGIGGLIWRVGQRQGRYDKVFALLVVIMIIGFLQDKMFSSLDKKFFPFKYDGLLDKKQNSSKSQLSNFFILALNAFYWLFLAIYTVLFINEFIPILSEIPILTDLFGGTVWIIHFYFLLLLGYEIYQLIYTKKQK